MIAALKEALPHSHVTLMIQPQWYDAIRDNPHVDAVLPTEHKPRLTHYSRYVRLLRRRRYDAVILCKVNSGDHTWITWLSGIPVRVGTTDKYYGRLLTHNLRYGEELKSWHEVEFVTGLAQPLCPAPLTLQRVVLPINESALQQASLLLASKGVFDAEPYFCVHPGTGGTCHAWYPERYSQVAQKVRARTGWTAVITGSQAEQPLASAVADQMQGKGVSIAGETSVQVLGAVLRRARLLISGDTAAVHVASSVGTPCVVVHPESDYARRLRRWHPWMVPYRAVTATAFCPQCTEQECRMGGHICRESITADAVVEAALSLIQQEDLQARADSS